MDSATKSLDAVLHGGEFDVYRDIPIFDEHDEFDADGKLIRKFGPAELAKIVERAGRRGTSGDLAPIGPGHTVPGVAETLQPPIWGYAGNFRVGRFGPGQKLGVLADQYIRKEVTLPSGEKLTSRQILDQFPRRSVEIWYSDNLIDWIALLKRTPMRDLGMTAGAYARERFAPWEGSPRFKDQAGRPIAAAFTAGKLRYSMENFMDDPTMPPDVNAQTDLDTGADELSPEEQKTAERFMRHYTAHDPLMKGLLGKYGAAFVSPTNAGFPAPTEEAARYQREKEGDATKIAELEKEVRLGRYERVLVKKQAEEGFEFDLADELEYVKDFGQEQFDKHIARIGNYQRSPADGQTVHVADTVAPNSGGFNDAALDKTLRVMREKGVSFDIARAAVK